MGNLLPAPDHRHVAGCEPGRGNELGERQISNQGEDLGRKQLGICDRLRMRGRPFAEIFSAPGRAGAAPLGRRTAVRRVDAVGALTGDRGATGLREGLVEVTLVVRQTRVAVDPVAVWEFPAAAFAAPFRPRRPGLGWRVGVAAAAVGAAGSPRSTASRASPTTGRPRGAAPLPARRRARSTSARRQGLGEPVGERGE
jgi:hypothetical protein